ncbi:1-deoxy-D-xylulose-5-phosphate synthase [Enterococcus pallens]|uniref:1-deoxy-D-xylulose-5-phosphate synthase n=1 Tax=Enterococcus pallens ATCC BAA-351 TaxID=1158607 RepID=R2SMG4_9ENTE|nr:1-deoxy-D-xylulose-5-phosphate synthase [Enterococcus pallens]EOH96345.1 1-deoxy-D-xylulose-5-phosphate synthase [Enterococcus pallens ATCC BAA-351]EOU14442.1 1-deoxy-D-xylulose-5-phosphate synthase [Enterococcus pallens ATCC BAA-351]OJG81070.1 1-deoxy-D-xylulose-5-phosphate synthase [Enterococcus pallens]
MNILSRINGPQELKNLNPQELVALADELRAAVLNRVSKVGGHVGPNLGITELTIAFHYVFQSPVDKIIWDVSHQSYPHKILTGRKNAYLEEDAFDDISGYTSQDESAHDFFKIGHTSTSISLAVGLAKARDLKQEKGNVVALIGDGSLSGGLAFEGLNNGAELNSNLIVVLNDNEMSIDENFGGLYCNLTELRKTNGKSPNNLFKSMGFDYQYVEQGNNVAAMIKAFEAVKDIDHPIVLHVHTEKGHGYSPAVEEKGLFHWRPPFDLTTGESLSPNSQPTYSGLIVEELLKKIASGTKDLVAINAAIPGMFDLAPLKAQQPTHYFDVGIAEGHSISFAAGLAKNGIRPVLFHSSYFLPRAYDQLSHDLAINQLPAVIIVGNGHLTESDITHQGIFDIPMINSIPNLKYLAPSSKEEVLSMLDWALLQTEGPVAIRLPAGPVVSRPAAYQDYSQPHYEVRHQGQAAAILALGNFISLGESVRQQLEKLLGVSPTLINPLTITELDQDCLAQLKANHSIVITLEDGSLTGGFGEKVAAYYGDSSMKVLNFGALKEFTDNVAMEELVDRYQLSPEVIAAKVLEAIK